jgi:transcriptional regulator with XRE-family HTH domain
VDAVKVFAINLKKYRNRLGISQESFAERAGLHRTYISAVECGKRSISLDNVQKIADALGVETYMLFIENRSLANQEEKEV